MLRALIAALAFVALTAETSITAPPQAALDPENTIYMDVGSKTQTYGRVVIRLRPDLAPKHCERIKTLARMGFYNGVPFHRVIPSFMAQTGDPTGTGTGHSDLPNLEPEFTDAPHYRGMVSMARAEDVGSANSQFFIMLNDKADLDGKYTVFGEVVAGMKFIDQIKKGDPDEDGTVAPPADRIVKMQVAADVKG